MEKVQSLPATRDQTISIRATGRQRDVSDRPARALGKPRSDFMLEISIQHAEDVMLDRTFFSLGTDAFERFEALLDAPPQPTEGLRRLLQRTAPWE